MKSHTVIVILGLVISLGAMQAQEVADDGLKSLKGEFVIREVILDTKKAKKLFPSESPFAGRMLAVKLEFIGVAPKWFGQRARWVQSLESPGEIAIGSRFQGEVHRDTNFGFHFPCFSPVQIYLKEAEQAGSSNGG
ncbi:hypothetical protein JIN85_13540 [Luteolibacter pohnpeiensis]|uniref:DUF2155 domain-containing protein n=1 Tax=Luteolibacter pohnpeiensis TaxID=454153 RepID=A0A934VXE5_9BACT|nr:hypothetical protein [Luteolibacter pohnpeiensis]MBK1883444.1 hypothetical protein [Luteolibacter pohnpeiensis]